ncbi:hypothetical protein MKW92_031064 [Papaver armeniacum]|nr:hypothetical protein MKW92_031064 [Papaver armeniacum]
MDAKSETKSFPMKGGDDQSSYVNNSSLQVYIPSPLYIYLFSSLFNDHASNDFNTLFLSLPSERKYFAAGVPGSFYTRLFPRSSLHIVYSSTALHWLSQVPKEVVDINSSAWNKGRIHHTDAPNEVLQAYSAQYVMDMEAFLRSRAHEVVCGGLMFLVIPGVIDGTNGSQTGGGFFDVLGSCLVEIAKMGMVDEAKVDSFNLPSIHSTYQCTIHPREVNESVEKNGYFSTERLEKMYSPGISIDHIQIFSDHLRAGLEVIIKQHFGFSKSDLDILFDMYTKRLVDSFPTLAKAAEKSLHMFFVLKRNNITIAY